LRKKIAENVAEDLPMASSQRGLAMALDRPLSTVRHWMDHAAWPFGRRGPWNVEGVRAWADLTFGPTAGPDIEPASDLSTLKRRAEVRVLVERGAKLRLEREAREGKLHDTSACLSRRLSQLHRFKVELLKLPRTIRRRLAGQTEAVIERRLEESLRQILDRLASDISSEASAAGLAADSLQPATATSRPRTAKSETEANA
jgi:hypothetical protein